MLKIGGKHSPSFTSKSLLLLRENKRLSLVFNAEAPIMVCVDMDEADRHGTDKNAVLGENGGLGNTGSRCPPM